MYKDPVKVKGLSDKDLTRIYVELKKVYKHYQEERIRRSVLKDLNAEQEPIFSDDSKEFNEER